MRFAYADPPYVGCAHLYPEKEEVDHAELFARLVTFDAWALSCSTPSLRLLLPMSPPETRVAAWVKPFASFKPGVRVAYAWEPVLFAGARKGTREDQTTRDWCAESITLERGLVGAKPAGFCFWLFDLIGLTPADELVDVFPGSGAVSKAWDLWCRQGRMFAPPMTVPDQETSRSSWKMAPRCGRRSRRTRAACAVPVPAPTQ